MPDPQFCFSACQIGAERALKAELARTWPDIRPAFSRPGYVTFKLPEGHGLRDDFHLHAVFSRSQGLSLGKVMGESDSDRALALRALAADLAFDELHVWVRSPRQVELLPAAVAALQEAQGLQPLGLVEDAIGTRFTRATHPSPTSPLILDCAIIEPNEWWIGYHRATTPETHWPGGNYPGTLPEHVVSRAYLKMQEALDWSQLPVRPGDHVAEIGCAPGGASQALLDRELVVMGVDPALVDERVFTHPRFTHVRKRGHEVKRREFRKTNWLTADMNVAPQYTLDTVEEIVTHKEVNIRGMLLTLKLLEWTLAEHVPEYLHRIRSWGFSDVRARQLSHNRQEICVAALRSGGF